MEIIYTIDESSYEQILEHLNECSKNFIPELSSYVDISEYSKKIYNKSKRFEAYCQNKLIGLIAIYINKDDSFITNVSVSQNFTGKDISQNLLNNCKKFIKNLNHHHSIFLEVKLENFRAIKFYKRHSFFIVENNEDNYKMQLKL